VTQDIPAHHLATIINFLNQQLSGLSLSSLRALQWEDISKGLHGAMCCRSHNAL
jgi:transcriptional regulator of heat shock response